MTTNTILLQAQQGGGFQSIIMIVAIIAIFYFFMIRPQQKRQKQIRQFREGLRSGDSVITAGGIHGRVKEVKDTYFVVEIADGVRIRVDKGSVYPSAAEANQDAANNQDLRK